MRPRPSPQGIVPRPRPGSRSGRCVVRPPEQAACMSVFPPMLMGQASARQEHRVPSDPPLLCLGRVGQLDAERLAKGAAVLARSLSFACSQAHTPVPVICAGVSEQPRRLPGSPRPPPHSRRSFQHRRELRSTATGETSLRVPASASGKSCDPAPARLGARRLVQLSPQKAALLPGSQLGRSGQYCSAAASAPPLQHRSAAPVSIPCQAIPPPEK